MQRVSNRVLPGVVFTRAPRRSEVPGANRVEQICHLVLADAEPLARTHKLRYILEQLSPRKQAYLVSRFSRR